MPDMGNQKAQCINYQDVLSKWVWLDIFISLFSQ